MCANIYRMWWTICVIFIMFDENTSYVNTKSSNASICTDKNYVFLSPGVLIAGANNRVCLSRLKPDGLVQVTVSLSTHETVSAFREMPPGDGGCLDLLVPAMPNEKAELNIKVWYPEYGCFWTKSLFLRISAGKFITVVLEKARYRPGETIRARIIVLRPDLTPFHGQLDEVWLEAPQGLWDGAKLAEWKNVKMRFGISQVQYDLDEGSPNGKWTLRAKMADGSQGAVSFWVAHYNVPQFQLSVKHPAKILRTRERLIWTVCVRYPWAEAVEGMLVIRLRAASQSNGVNTAVRLRSPKACHRHAVSSKRLSLTGKYSPDLIVADFSFQENGSKAWQNTTVVTQVVDQAVLLEFMTKHPTSISPGLPYKLKVKATRWDGKPAPNEIIKICGHPSNRTDDTLMVNNNITSCENAVTDVQGIARTLFSVTGHNHLYFAIKASLLNSTSVSASIVLPIVRSGKTQAALGLLRSDSAGTNSFVPLYLNIDTANPITVHFVVITRGGNIHRWGATTQCPTTNYSRFEIASKNDLCTGKSAKLQNINDTNTYYHMSSASFMKNFSNRSETFQDDNISDSLVDRHWSKVILPIKLSHQICPESHLIAFFYHNGELVSANKLIEHDECFANKVEVAWQEKQVLPGSKATLKIKSPVSSLCALSVMDTAAKWVDPPPNLKDSLMFNLKRFIGFRKNLTVYDVTGGCFISESDSASTSISNEERLALRLANAGIRMSGENFLNVDCDTLSPAPLTTAEIIVQRSDFSEAWLWRTVVVDGKETTEVTAKAPDSITRFEAVALCLTRHGITVTTPTVLQTFRDFFIQTEAPQSLRRGDTVILKYRVFNYLYEPINVKVDVTYDDYYLQVDNKDSSAVCLGARESIARRAQLRGLSIGLTKLSVRADSVRVGTCNKSANNNSNIISDEVIIELLVEEEGFSIQKHKSTLMCGTGSKNLGPNEVKWDWPNTTFIAGTQTFSLEFYTDIAAPPLYDSDDLKNLPRNCGEQNMVFLASNFLALPRLDSKSATAIKAKSYMVKGFINQLKYAHQSGGFSAFTQSDEEPSTWLTAFCLRYLYKIHQEAFPNTEIPTALVQTERWLLSQQMENGCFRNHGQVFHRELRGGLNSDNEIANIALTAYIVISLLESETYIRYDSIKNSLACLNAAFPNTAKQSQKIYTQSLLAYAFMKIKMYNEELQRQKLPLINIVENREIQVLVELLKMAKRNGEYVWWETDSISSTIESTSYALLALSSLPRDILSSSFSHDTLCVVKWLGTQRSNNGEFISTQDTLVATEALILWSSIYALDPTKLVLTVQTDGRQEKFSLDTGPETTLKNISIANDLIISAEGTGCVLVQATRSYRALEPQNDKQNSMSLQVTVHTDGSFDCDSNKNNCFCAAIIEACVIWIGVFPEIALLEVSLPGGYAVDAPLLYSQLKQNNSMLRRIDLSANKAKVNLYLGYKRNTNSENSGHSCHKIYTVGPQVNSRAAYATILDYHRPTIRDTVTYTIPRECPAQIYRAPKTYSYTDNLFYKAKSFDLDGDVIMTEEIPFDDEPEFVPLDESPAKIFSNDIKVANTKSKETETLPQKINMDKNFNISIVNHNRKKLPDKYYHQKVAATDISSKNTTKNFTVKRDKSKLGTFTEIPEFLNKIHNIRKREVINPFFSGFHVVDTYKDLEVPDGIEGPIPAYVLPPPTFTFTRSWMYAKAKRKPVFLNEKRGILIAEFPIRKRYYFS